MSVSDHSATSMLLHSGLIDKLHDFLVQVVPADIQNPSWFSCFASARRLEEPPRRITGHRDHQLEIQADSGQTLFREVLCRVVKPPCNRGILGEPLVHRLDDL
eukprot:CAMPEP_0119325562 /NCGR_PEP_ID=MMETSP1333-20130426/66141_1 /TAXON_ID=418940 /ORGANISM="Scyphosphaera apsteinii, Strain RCC1455" /LENGTH=102 /DNA_ID=CAMNT_0007333585 /DNA_START=47 /DNA_END=353 /DNA_ORIENTATION=+